MTVENKEAKEPHGNKKDGSKPKMNIYNKIYV